MVMVRMARPQQRTAAGQLVRAAQHPWSVAKGWISRFIGSNTHLPLESCPLVDTSTKESIPILFLSNTGVFPIKMGFQAAD